jgi:hypothetical protein
VAVIDISRHLASHIAEHAPGARVHVETAPAPEGPVAPS